jgi:hypothetical protein
VIVKKSSQEVTAERQTTMETLFKDAHEPTRESEQYAVQESETTTPKKVQNKAQYIFGLG